MTAAGEDHVRPVDDNPFPVRAAAESQDLTDNAVNVETPAITRAVELLDSYFGRTGTEGVALAVSGEAGTGKTHLIYQILRRVHRRKDSKYAYIDAQGGGFRNLYRGFLMQIDRDRLVRRIREYYAHIVADAIKDTGFPDDIRQRLRNCDIDPQRFVTRFSLPESTFFARLNAELAEVTGNEEYGTALMLLLRGDPGDLHDVGDLRDLSDVSDAVWEWLRGEAPSALLVERGIRNRIRTDAQALDAMGVIALLYHGRASHCVLAFDQLDKVLPSSSQPPDETVAALQQLMRRMIDQGIFLVLSGLPEFVDAIGRYGQEHNVTEHITTTGLSAGQVRSYIRQNIATTHYRQGLGPFSPEIADYIAALAGHSARQVIQICHACYRMSMSPESRVVTRAMVEQAARGRAEIDQSLVHKRISEELDKQARVYHTGHPVGGLDGPRAPFWIPTGDTGCALFVSDTLISDDDTTDLIETAKMVRAAAPGCRVGLIVSGFLSDRAREKLRDHFSEPPLVYIAERFGEDFTRLLSHMTEQIEASGDDQLRMLRATMSRLSTAQNNTQHFLEMLASQVKSMRSASEQQYADLARQLQQVDHGERGPQLPDEVERLFTNTLTSLKAIIGLDAALGELFGEQPSGVAPGLLLRLQNREVIRAFGVAAVAETVIAALQDAVTGWHRRLIGTPNAEERRRLKALCRNYERVLDYLPIHLLSTFTELIPDSPSRSAGVGQARGGWSSQTDVYALLTDLGYQVRQAFGIDGLHD